MPGAVRIDPARRLPGAVERDLARLDLDKVALFVADNIGTIWAGPVQRRRRRAAVRRLR